MDPRKCFLSSILVLVALEVSVSGQTTVNGAFGGSADFNSSLPPTLPAQYTLTWLFNGITVAQMYPGGKPECNDLYQQRCVMYNNGSLRLGNLTFTDQGRYTLQITSISMPDALNYLYDLSVFNRITHAATLGINSTTPNELIAGTYLSLYCDAGGQNVTTYIFYHDGKDICSQHRGSCSGAFFHFQPITSDSGNYSCTIENPISKNGSNTLQLTVLEPVSGVTLSTSTSEVLWPDIDSVSLRCSANGTNVNYSWNLEGAPLPSDSRYQLSQKDSVLTISPVTAKDNGTFTCSARNIINNETSNGVTLSLGSRVSEVILTNSTSKLLWAGNDSVTLHCSALGSAVHFSWSLNGRPLPRDPRYNITSGDSPPNSNLTINPVAKSDDGSFTCTVSNRLNNETSDSMILNLAWHPNGNILCRADQKDQNVQLGCSWPEGRPEAIVTLRFQNINLNGTSVVTSEVSPDNASSGTQLSCYGDQLGKTSNCTLQLERPQFTGTNNTDEKVEEGKTIELKVILVETGLPAKFAWFHYNPNRVPISSARSTRGFTVISTNFTSTLRIADANMEYNGKYECEAQNFIGKESFIFNVNVTKAVVPPPPPKGLDGGEIAGIVIGVLAGIALIGILVFFLVKRNKRKGESKGTVNEPEVSAGIPVYAQVNKQNNKQNGGAAETSLTNKPQDNIEDIKYATLNFLNQPSAKAPSPTTEETEYSQVKITNKR